MADEKGLLLERIKDAYFDRLRNIAQIVRSDGHANLSTRFTEDELPVEACYYCEGRLEGYFFVFREKGTVFAMMKDCSDYLANDEENAIRERQERFYDFYMRKQNKQN